jgi:hypothetical protein
MCPHGIVNVHLALMRKTGLPLPFCVGAEALTHMDKAQIAFRDRNYLALGSIALSGHVF